MLLLWQLYTGSGTQKNLHIYERERDLGFLFPQPQTFSPRHHKHNHHNASQKLLHTSTVTPAVASFSLLWKNSYDGIAWALHPDCLWTVHLVCFINRFYECTMACKILHSIDKQQGFRVMCNSLPGFPDKNRTKQRCSATAVSFCSLLKLSQPHPLPKATH